MQGNAEQEDIEVSSALQMAVGPPPKTGATRLREMLADPHKTVVCPGVYDGLTARIALKEGFECLYMVREHLP